jgi:hypothetical protein
VRPSVQRVAHLQRVAIVGRVGDGHARAEGVARAEQRAEVRTVGDPQRCDDQMIPTSMSAVAALTAQIARGALCSGRAHRTDRVDPSLLT